MWYLGVDGGGTKTRFVLLDVDMEPQHELRLPTCHPAQVGYDGMQTVLAEGIVSMAAATDEPLGIGFGLAGYGQDPAVRARIEHAVAAAAGDHPYELVNDVEAAWAACHAAHDGIVVICGTGSIAYGRAGERGMRCGGWGYRVGDEGSGYWLGHEVLRLFSRQADGRDPRGPLFDIVMERLELSQPYDIISYAADELVDDRTKIASLTKLMHMAGRAGDPCALEAYGRQAVYLAELVRVIRRELFGKRAGIVPVSYVGGVFEGAGELLLEPFRRELPQDCELVKPAYGPAVGPCLLLRRRLKGKR